MDAQPIVIETDDFKITIEGNYFYCEYYAQHLDLDSAQRMVEVRYKHMNGRTIYVYTDIRNLRSITKEARDYLSKGRAVENIGAAVMLANSNAIRLMFNFFLTFNKPPVPMKLFNKKDEAIQWLKAWERERD